MIVFFESTLIFLSFDLKTLNSTKKAIKSLARKRSYKCNKQDYRFRCCYDSKNVQSKSHTKPKDIIFIGPIVLKCLKENTKY